MRIDEDLQLEILHALNEKSNMRVSLFDLPGDKSDHAIEQFLFMEDEGWVELVKMNLNSPEPSLPEVATARITSRGVRYLFNHDAK